METDTITELRKLLADINPIEVKSHLEDGTTISWLTSWRAATERVIESERQEVMSDREHQHDTTQET